MTTLLFSFLFSSCSEEVINIDFDVFEKSIVIEGIITDNQNPAEVKIHRIQSYFEDNISSTVSGAEVIIYDDSGNIDTLSESAPGNYISEIIKGVPGRTYFLNVNVDGQEYKAASRMPEPIIFSQVKTEFTGTNTYNLVMTINDVPGAEEFCRILIYRNGYLKNEKMYTDINSDGDIITIIEEGFYRNDRITIELISISKSIYTYFSDLKELIDNEDNDSSELVQLTAGNPKSNISNNGLGYFSAQTNRVYKRNY